MCRPTLPIAAGDRAGSVKLDLGGRAGRRARQRQSQKDSKDAVVGDQDGRQAGLVSRHRANGVVSSNHRNNKFISVGDVRNVHRATLAAAYPGGLCESSLCSFRQGNLRFLVCDCNGNGKHEKFPEVTGPRDKEKWARIMKTSKRLHVEALKMLAKRPKR